MLAYAPRPQRRRVQPGALALIIGAHAGVIVAVMSTKMDLAVPWRSADTDVTFVPLPPEPAPEPPPADPIKSTSAPRPLDAPRPVIDSMPAPGPVVDALPLPPDPGPLLGADPGPGRVIDPPVVRTGPRFATPDDQVRPPYPEAMRASEREATLRLRLAIDERGRVTAVEPVGKVDAAFLDAARRHILKAWRYAPAMDGERAVPSTTVVTLRFELD